MQTPGSPLCRLAKSGLNCEAFSVAEYSERAFDSGRETGGEVNACGIS